MEYKNKKNERWKIKRKGVFKYSKREKQEEFTLNIRKGKK